jgi:hypothetical protein
LNVRKQEKRRFQPLIVQKYETYLSTVALFLQSWTIVPVREKGVGFGPVPVREKGGWPEAMTVQELQANIGPGEERVSGREMSAGMGTERVET